MTRFLLNSFCFGLGLLAINMFFNGIVYEAYYEEYGQVDLNFDTYLMADSHGDVLHDQTEAYGVYNFAAGSESYEDIKKKVAYLIENSDVKRILISVDNHTLSKYRERSNNSDRGFYYEQPTTWLETAETKSKELKQHLSLLNPKFSPVVRSKLKEMVTGPSKRTQWAKLSEKEQARVSKLRFSGQFPEEEQSEILKTTLEEIIALCKENNIELIGIKFPLAGDYRALIGDRDFNADEIFEEHGLPVHDFMDLYLDNDDLFLDQDHLNDAGVKAFLKVLSEQAL